MTKFVIDGKKYDMGEALFQPPIGAVNELRAEYGILPNAIKKQFEDLGDAREQEGFDADEYMYSEQFQKAFFGLIFLGMRRAGDKVTIQDVKDKVALLSYTDIEFVADEVVDAPKAPPSSGPGDENEPDSSVTP